MTDQFATIPIPHPHRTLGDAGGLTFVGGMGDFDGGGAVRSPGDLRAQLAGSLQNLDAVLASEGCGLADVLRLKVYYLCGEETDPWAILAQVLAALPSDPSPAVTMQPVTMEAFPGALVQVQAIARRDWRSTDDIRVETRRAPERCAAEFPNGVYTSGLRAGEFISVPGRTVGEEQAGASDAIAQTEAVMGALGDTLHGLGASFADTVKKEGYYFGTDLDQWAEMAAVRARHFSEPGPAATVVPWHVSRPQGARTQIEVLAMRDHFNGYDKYIPRDDSWPERSWDWSIPVPYRQGVRLRDTIWLGGQVPWAPGENSGKAVLPGRLEEQTRFVMKFIDDILHGFRATTADLALLVCYFTSDGTPECSERFLDTLAGAILGPLPPITLVPQPYMHTSDTMVEIWGVARG